MHRAPRRILVSAALAVALAQAACGGDSPGTPDAGAFPTAPHSHYPTLSQHSGMILANTQLVTITFNGYSQAANVEAFGDFIYGSDWFRSVGDEYGVHPGTHVAKIRLSDNPPATFGDLDARNLITNKLNANLAGLPKPGGANTQLLYAIYVPPQTMPGVPGVYGYHDNFSYQGNLYAYTVIYDFGTGLAVTTTTASHEYIEAATDPYPSQTGSDGYWLDRPNDDLWFLASGFECADLCDSEAPIFAGPWTVQRSWSSRNALLGISPCVPADTHWEAVTSTPSTITTIHPGNSITFTLTGWSTVAVSDWTITLTAADNSDLLLNEMNPVLSTSTMNNGKTATLKLTAPTGSSGKFGGVYVRSGNQLRTWPVGFLSQ